MTLNRNDTVIAFFGQNVREEPFLIDTEGSVGDKFNTSKSESLKKSMDATVFGETFNKILPEIEPYLKAVYDNKDLPKRRAASLSYTVDAIGLNAQEEVNFANIQENINRQVKKMKPKMP